MATCKDCLHNEACNAVLDAAGFFSDDIEEILNAIKCPNFVDKSRFAELPCKVGDTIWIFVYPNHPPCEARVRSIFISNNSVELNCAVKGYFAQTVNAREFGETIFLTREEAEAAFAERRNE